MTYCDIAVFLLSKPFRQHCIDVAVQNANAAASSIVSSRCSGCARVRCAYQISNIKLFSFLNTFRSSKCVRTGPCLSCSRVELVRSFHPLFSIQSITLHWYSCILNYCWSCRKKHTAKRPRTVRRSRARSALASNHSRTNDAKSTVPGRFGRSSWRVF